MAIEKATEPADSMETGETTTIPLSIVGGQEVKPGDVVRLRVVSVDGENLTVEYDDGESEKEDESENMDMKMAADKFNNMKEE